jgi:hypothetical protein
MIYHAIHFGCYFTSLTHSWEIVFFMNEHALANRMCLPSLTHGSHVTVSWPFITLIISLSLNVIFVDDSCIYTWVSRSSRLPLVLIGAPRNGQASCCVTPCIAHESST